MEKEVLNTYLDRFHAVENQIDDMYSILCVLSEYCDAYPDNKEIYNISVLINKLRDNSKETLHDLIKTSDDLVKHFLV